MSDTKIVAMIDRSAGNDRVGDMWTETKVFSIHETLNVVYIWATGIPDPTVEDVAHVRANIKLSIAQ